jgi:mannosyltransferase
MSQSWKENHCGSARKCRFHVGHRLIACTAPIGRSEVDDARPLGVDAIDKLSAGEKHPSVVERVGLDVTVEATPNELERRAVDVRRAVVLVAAAMVAAGVAWRFATLGVQSYWFDESYTVDIVRKSFGGMLKEIPQTESTPPFFYVVAWLWAKVFGTGEAGLRSLSALCGTATIVVSYFLGRRLAGRTVGAIAAALVAVNPFLVWYSQEARAYSLMVFLTAASLLFVLRADERRQRYDYALWVLLAGLAVATHYFALMFVGGEIAWLVGRRRSRNAASLTAGAAIGLISLALLPLVVYQGKNTYVFSHESIVKRAAQVPKQFMIGFDAPHEDVLGLVVVVLSLVALLALTRRRNRSRADSTVLAALVVVAASSLVIPFLVVVLGTDYVNTRNLMAALVPLLVLAALGFSATRPMLVAAAVVVLISLLADVAVARNPSFQRTDYRGAIRTLAPLERVRVLIIPGNYRPIRIYARNSRLLEGAAQTEEVVFFNYNRHPSTFRPPKGFRLVRSVDVQQLSVETFRSARPVALSTRSLAARVRSTDPAYGLVQTPSGG